MTREDIECIIKWFSHIEQLATDGKTANGFQMPTDRLLATIKVVAKDSREYVEKFCNESVPNDLEEAASEYENGYFYDCSSSKRAAYHGFVAGYKFHEAHAPLPEDTVIYQKGVEEGKRLMMEEAVECELYYDGDFLAIDLNMAELGYSERDKVRVIILKEG